MSARIEWNNAMPSAQPKTIGRLPRKPVVWIGEIGLKLPDGELDIRSWRSNQAISTEQAKTVSGASLVNS